jgi:beta-lactamase class A
LETKANRNAIYLDEIASLFVRMYKGQLVSPEYDKQMIDILLTQQIEHKIPKKLPYNISVAHKTGEVEGVSHDIGIVYAKKPFVIGFTSQDTDVPVFEELIRDVSRMLTELMN